MSRNRTIFILVFLALFVGAVAGYALLPKRYSEGEHLAQANVFWNDKEEYAWLGDYPKEAERANKNFRLKLRPLNGGHFESAGPAESSYCGGIAPEDN